MPTPIASSRSRPADLVSRLGSYDAALRLKALRDIKNQIIGNRTKKLAYVKLGAVPAVASILNDAAASCCDCIYHDLLIQSAATLGSFACGVDVGAKAVVDSGALPDLLKLISISDDKVVDCAARSLKMIYQSKLAPKCDLLEPKNVEFLKFLLDSRNENVMGLVSSIISHSCEMSTEQKALCDAGVLDKLVNLLSGSPSQRDASLDSLTKIIRNNPEVTSKFLKLERGRGLSLIVMLTKDRSPHTRLLACSCLITIRNMSSCYPRDMGIEGMMISHLLELLEDSGEVGDEASFALSSLLEEQEDLQRVAFENHAIDKLYKNLQNGRSNARRMEGVLLAFASLCSNLELCRAKLSSPQAFDLVSEALIHDSANIRVAACLFLRYLSRSIKTSCAGHFMNESVVVPLLQHLDDPSEKLKLAALLAISNIVINCKTHKSTFRQHGGTKKLVQLACSTDSYIRFTSLRALRNLTFLADDECKEEVFSELTASYIATLICDSEPFIQEQALALLRNLIDGHVKSIDRVFAEDRVILEAVKRQLLWASNAEVMIQGMYVLSNIASGSEIHKDAVMLQLVGHGAKDNQSFIIKFLQNNDCKLRTASMWAILNLTISSCRGASGRVSKLRKAGIISQLKSMVSDPCLDVKVSECDISNCFAALISGSWLGYLAFLFLSDWCSIK